MDEEKEERIDEILEDINRDVELPPYNENAEKRRYSKLYQEYKESEKKAQEKTFYERLCYQSASVLGLSAPESVKKKLYPGIKLMGWEITPGMVLSATAATAIGGLALWLGLAVLNWTIPSSLGYSGGLLPPSLIAVFGIAPVLAAYFVYTRPVYAAKNKVIQSSGEMILAVLYMVVYMRSSPNIEGAVRFAALNLEGPIADDLKDVLWRVEVGEFKRVGEALEDYTKRWKDFNKDFLESLNLIRAATNQPNPDRQEKLLQDAIDNILDGTQEKMKHYAQNLETPVMILNAVGALLPILGMIMLPLISAFLGGLITPIHLVVVFNILLPVFLWIFMQRTLSSRPPTVNTKPVSEGSLPTRGRTSIEFMGEKREIPVWPIAVIPMLLLTGLGVLGYISFPHMYPGGGENLAHPLFVSGETLNAFPMLMRSLLIVAGIGLSIGVYLLLGSRDRLAKEEQLKSIEQEFPSALFELGNQISGGTPVELALKQASKSTSDLEISGLFEKASRNIEELGMTFEQSIFDDEYGALQEYPSQMIRTVMKAVLESSKKGTTMAAEAMMTVSRYLENIHGTQEKLRDLMEETTTTIQMMAYLLAPVISGVAVAMSQTIISGLFQIKTGFQQSQDSLPAAGSAPDYGGILGGLENSIPPEALQMVVGLYLIQLLYILGTFYMKITRGQDPTYRDVFTGKTILIGFTIYAATLIAISSVFGSLMTGVANI